MNTEQQHFLFYMYNDEDDCDVVCTGAAAASSSAPYFTEEPRSSVVRRGDSVSLRCAASSTASADRPASESTDDVTVTWTHNGRTLDNPSSSSSSSSQVDIRSFRRSDEGLYQCIANSSLGALISRPATLRLARTLIYVLFIHCVIWHEGEEGRDLTCKLKSEIITLSCQLSSSETDVRSH